MIVVLQLAHDPIVRYVAEQQIAAGTEIGGALRPAKAGGDTLDRACPGTAFEPLRVQGLDVCVGVARAASGTPVSPSGPTVAAVAALSVAAVALAADAAMNARLFMDPPNIARRLILGAQG